MTVPARILSLPVHAWRLLLSPVLPGSCRYAPSCSDYALQALRRFGALRGGWLSVRRIGRCHPWGGSGYDPVPDRTPLRAQHRDGTAGPASERSR